MEASGRQGWGDILSVTLLLCYKYRVWARAGAGKSAILPGEQWESLDQCRSREVVVMGLDAVCIVRVDPVGFPSGLPVGHEGEREVRSDSRVSGPKPQDGVYNELLTNIRKATCVKKDEEFWN